MEKRYTDLFHSLINEILDAEKRFELALGDVDGKFSFCEGMEFTLGKLKDERLENTGFYKNLEKKINNDQGWLDERKENIFMNNGNEVYLFWDKFHKLVKKCANEDRSELAAKKIEFDSEI